MKISWWNVWSLLVAGVVAQPASPPKVAAAPVVGEAVLDAFGFRSLGPANMGGRIVDLAVDPATPSTFFLAAATGGIWRTENAGTTFEPVFQGLGTGSFGAVAVAPSRPADVWVGTGEGLPRNSVTYGDGVYRSRDGGKTWTHVGLTETRHITRIVVHPQNPDVVYVAALGQVWGPNPERGLFKTTDGGQSWEHVLAIDENTGCSDLVLDPRNPSRLWVAAYEVRRDAFDGNDPAIKYGKKAGIFRSVDDGKNFVRLTEGLPTVAYGRTGLTVFEADPNFVFAIIETELTGKDPPKVEGEENSPTAIGYLGMQAEDESSGGAKLVEITRGGPAERADLRVDDIVTEFAGEAVQGFEDFAERIRSQKANAKVSIKVKRGDQELIIEATLGARPPERASGQLGGQLENRHAAQGSRGFETGGVFLSENGGDTWKRINSVNPRPFYYSQIRVDPKDRNYLWVLGTSLYRSKDGGSTFQSDGARRVHVDHHAMWIDRADPRHVILGNDGGLCVSFDRGENWEFLATIPLGQYYAVTVDDREPYRMYGGLQDNGSWGWPRRSRDGPGLLNDHVYRIGGGDGFVCAVDPTDPDTVYYESQGGAIGRMDLRTGSSTPVRKPRRPREEEEEAPYRFNWKTPFQLSPHNPRTLWYAGNHVFKSINRGDRSTEVSPGITLTPQGSATALAESPLTEGVVWVGTDDGALWLTRDGGRKWTSLQDRLPSLPGPRWVAHITASRRDTDKAFVILDGHRSADWNPYVYVTEDGGETFKLITRGLPRHSTRVLREDPSLDDVLYLGTEIGVYVSFDDGDEWERWTGGLPTVAVHDLAIAVRDRELVVGTHGQSLWVGDLSAFPALAGWEKRPSTMELLAARGVTKWIRRDGNGKFGKRRFLVPREDEHAQFWVWVPAGQETTSKLAIEDVMGESWAELEIPKEEGVHRVTWNLRRDRKAAPLGTYRAILAEGDKKTIKTFVLRGDPAMEGSAASEGGVR